MKTAVLLVVLVAVGCGGPAGTPDDYGTEATIGVKAPARGIWIASDVPVGPVLAACAMWGEFGLSCNQTVDKDDAWIVVESGHEPDCRFDQGNIWLGSSNWRRVSIRTVCWPLADTSSAQAEGMRITVTHEFGHALGLSHVNDPDAVMWPESKWGVNAFTAADRMEFLRVWGTGAPP